MLYGVFKIFRTAFSPGKIALILLDVLFMIMSALSLFMFSLAYLLGFVRVYIILGALIGFLAYRFTLETIFSKLYCPIIKFIGKVIRIFCNYFKKIAKSLLKITHIILYNKNEELRLFTKKPQKSADNKKVMVKNEAKRFKGKGGPKGQGS